MNSLSSHVLDTTKGKPAAQLAITLTTPDGRQIEGITDSDGRCSAWQNTDFVQGVYCIRFHTGDYLKAQHGDAFYPFVDVHFVMTKGGGHYHIPLLISPFGYSSYRGS